jgi:hypothetical protein
MAGRIAFTIIAVAVGIVWPLVVVLAHASSELVDVLSSATVAVTAALLAIAWHPLDNKNEEKEETSKSATKTSERRGW